MQSDTPIFVVKHTRDPGPFYYRLKIKLVSFFCVEHNLKPLLLLEPMPALLKAKDKKYKSPNLIFLMRSFFSLGYLNFPFMKALYFFASYLR